MLVVGHGSNISTCSCRISFTRLVIILWCQGNLKFLLSCFANNFSLYVLCSLIGAIILSINIQVGLNMHLYDDIGGMHRRPFVGRHLVTIILLHQFLPYTSNVMRINENSVSLLNTMRKSKFLLNSHRHVLNKSFKVVRMSIEDYYLVPIKIYLYYAQFADKLFIFGFC